MNSFGWASTTELGKGESIENLRSMPSPSRSGSEEELRENKDEEISDEEESEVFSNSKHIILHLIPIEQGPPSYGSRARRPSRPSHPTFFAYRKI